jgi:hypothetical protein
MIEISLRASGVVTASQVKTLVKLNLRPVVEDGTNQLAFSASRPNSQAPWRFCLERSKILQL